MTSPDNHAERDVIGQGRGRQSRPWLDPGLDVERRIDLLMGELNLQEKAWQLHLNANLEPVGDHELIARGAVSSSLYASGATAGNVRDEGLMAAASNECQHIAVEESRLGIPIIFGRDVIHGHRSVFPIPLALAAAWDEELATACCRLAAKEASVDGVAWTFAPMVDISEEPRWGRVAESLGESPVLAGRLAAAMVRGFQGEHHGQGESIVACAKHFAGYGLVRGGRDYDTVTVGENTLRNLHLRPFRHAVDAGCASVMAAFNDVDGIPMHAHRHLMRDILKGEWGFDGVVVGDWNGVGQLVDQGVACDLRDAARQAMLAGLDLDMVSGAYAAHLPDLVTAGEVPLQLVDDAVRRVLRMKFRAGLFEHPYVDAAAFNDEPSEEARALARRAATSSLVLLKNNGVLPLQPDTSTLHLTGPFVNEGEALLGTWCLDGKGSDVISPAAAFREHLGAQELLVSDGRFSDLAMSMVRSAEVTIALVGEHPSRSGEDRCISTLELPSGQLDVLREMAGLGKPLVVVVFAGRPLELGPVMEIADAVVLAWHPGIEAGPAIADVIFGKAAPSGRLPITFPRTVGHIPSSSHERPTGRRLSREDDTRIGRYLDSLAFPELVFGFGLTYTTFEYGELSLSSGSLSVSGGSITASIEVTNSGTRPGREVVQLYLRDRVADVTRPIVELADWSAVELKPGHSKRVEFEVEASMFGYFGQNMTWRVDPGEVDVIVGPNSASGPRARLELEK
jgi:beta-glucosidase